MPGGMMRYGIPAFRLPRAVLDAEIDAIVALGITVHLGCAIGRDVLVRRTARRVTRRCCVTVGCQQGRTLQAPGAELPGVVRAVDFLRASRTRDVAATRSRGARASRCCVTGRRGGDRRRQRGLRRGAQCLACRGARQRLRRTDGARRSPQRRAPRWRRAVTMVAPEARHALPVPAEELHEATVEGVRAAGRARRGAHSRGADA